MTDRRLGSLLQVTVVVGGTLSIVATSMIIVLSGLEQWLTGFDTFVSLFVLFFAAFVWLVAPRQPRNAVVWTMVSSVLFGGLTQISSVVVVLVFDLDPSIELIPAELPTGAAWILLFTGWMWIPALLPILTYGLLLFPDGRLPSPGWRWVGRLAGAGLVLLALGTIWTYRVGNTTVVETGLTVNGPWLVVLVAALLSVAGLITRFRRSAGETRQQIKWILWGASSFIPVFLGLGFVLSGGPNEDLLLAPVYAAEVLFLGSYGMAVAKYRLFDIDVVISRTFVYGTLAVFITVVYVAAVVGIGQIIGSGEEPNPVLAIAATALVAVGFQPLRRRLQSVANRLVYGRRATPYEVLSTFSQRVAAVDPTVLTQIAKALVEGTTADAAGVWMNRGSGRQLIAQWPPDHGLQIRVSPDDPPEYVRVADVVHDNEPLGLVTLSLQPGQPFSPVDAALLDQVAAGLGLALRNLRLTEDLRDRLEELRDSRRRIVAVQDQTRRRLERDLHDGAQQRLVSLKIKLGIGSTMATKAGLDDVRDLLDTLRADADQTIEAVRDFARGIYPPLLEAEGLGTALVARTAKSVIPVTVQAAGVSRYPREVEATVYFSVLEAVQNAVTHSGGRSVLVTMTDDDGHLTFEVRDDGKGFDINGTPFGPGLTNVADRIDALDGTLEVSSSPGKGTIARGTIPTHELVVTR